MNKTCGVAVIGYGGMGGWHTQRLLEMPEEFTLCGIYDIDPKRAAAAEEVGIHAYASLDELWADARVQVVTVAIPNDIHCEMTCAALRAGKHVVCEKPVAMNSAELQTMIDTAAACDRVFTVHQNRRWDHDYRIVKRLVDENTLGPIFTIESRVHGSRGIPGDWRNKKRHGGGMVLDWGVHLLDQILLIAGDRALQTVYAQFDNVTNEECEDGFKILLQFEGGLRTHIEVGTSHFIALPRWYVAGENGSAIVEDWNLNGKIVMVSDWEKRDAVPVVTAAGLTKTMAPRTNETIREYPLPAVEGDIHEFYRNVRDTAEGRAELIVKHDEVKRVMKLMETVFTSAESNQVITWEEPQ
ncbi:MAG: Gfo/Idh/MocA family oxidoreductase [Clostridia bacterium]|nr:Gfo/Idh/MocA family oxidoreductase [Clostridia bacterium]